MSAPRLPALFLAIQKPTSMMIPIRPISAKKQPLKKFVMSLRNENFNNLTSIAGARGISIQELLRAVIIPEWTKTTVKKTVASPTVPLRTF
jgi:hypothetical protein